jgi:hypothetical protein
VLFISDLRSMNYSLLFSSMFSLQSLSNCGLIEV